MSYSTPVTTPVVLAVVFLPLTILVVLARFNARHVRKAPLMWDDWTCIPALVTVMGNIAVMLVAACAGELGKKVALSPSGRALITPEYVVYQKCFTAQQALITVSLALSRHSILLLYHRIFARGSKVFLWCVWILYVLNAANAIAFSFTAIFNCRPMSDAWTQLSGTQKRRCLTPTTFAHIRTGMVTSCVLDAIVLCLPWPMVMRLKLSTQKKSGLLGIFMLGSFVVGAAIGKTVTMFNISSRAKRVIFAQYEQAPFVYWGICETCVALICACLPTLRPVFLKIWPATFAQSISSAFRTSAFRSAQSGGTTRKTASNPKITTEVNTSTESVRKFARLSDGNSPRRLDEEAAWELELGEMRKAASSTPRTTR